MNSFKYFIVGAMAAAAAGTANASDLSKMPGQEILPKDLVKLSGVIPAMGEHWGNPKDMPLGPIYCVYEGKVICLEFMIAQADFQAGKSWPNLMGIEGLPPVNHVSIGFEPKGHEGYEVPHYDVHMYFISPEELKKVK